jgi:NADH-quinone oxidoreductase subunit L
MIVPLILLAVLSAFGGWINVPEVMQESFLGLFGALPMSEWLHHWLEPITHAADEIRVEHVGEFHESSPFGGGEVLWAAMSTLAALAVVAAAFTMVGRARTLPADQAGAPATGLQGLLYHKWYVDELYDRIVVRPVVNGSRFLWRVVDQRIVDGLVNAVGNVTRAVGWFGSLFQTGAVNTYALILTLGVLAILGYVALI